MSQLIALMFDDPYKAEEAHAALRRLAGDGKLELQETALISKNAAGKLRLMQDVDVVGRDQKIGHLAGLVSAAVTGVFPFILGATVAGHLVGTLTDSGITNTMIKDVKKHLQPGTSCLIVFGSSDPERRQVVADRLRPLGPKVLESDLPPDVEHAIQKALE